MPETTSIKVATFNIQHGSKGDYGRGYPGLLAEACSEINADIIALQEVDVGVSRSGKANLAEIAAEAADMNYVFAKSRTYRGRGQHGNALLARGDIKDVEVLNLKGDRHTVAVRGRRMKLVPHPRNAIIANVVVDEHVVAVGSTHVGGEKKKEQLRRAAARLACRSAPKILLGDYNLQWQAAQNCIEDYGFEVIKGPPTNPSWQPTQQIDHIALNGLHLSTMHTLPRLPVSDHLALVGEVKL